MTSQGENKKKRVVTTGEEIPYDIWCEIVPFFDSYQEFKNLVLTIEGLYEHIKLYRMKCCQFLPFQLYKLPKDSNKEKLTSFHMVIRLVITTSRITTRKSLIEVKNSKRGMILLTTELLDNILDTLVNLKRLTIFRENDLQIQREDTTEDYTYICFGKENTIYPNLEEFTLHFMDGGFEGEIEFESTSFPNLNSIFLNARREGLSLFKPLVTLEVILEAPFENLEEFTVIGFHFVFNIPQEENSNSTPSRTVKLKQISKQLKKVKFTESCDPNIDFSGNGIEILKLERVRKGPRDQTNEVNKICDMRKSPNLKELILIMDCDDWIKQGLINLPTDVFEYPSLTHLTIHGFQVELTLLSLLFKNLIYLDFDIPFDFDILNVITLRTMNDELEFPKHLETLKVSTRYNENLVLRNLPESVKNLYITIKKFRIVVNFDHIRSSLEFLYLKKIYYDDYWTQILDPSKPSFRPFPELMKITETGGDLTCMRRIENLPALKELVLDDFWIHKGKIEVSNCESLKKASFEFTTDEDILVKCLGGGCEMDQFSLSDLPNLEFLKLKNDLCFNEITYCNVPKVSTLHLHRGGDIPIPDEMCQTLKKLVLEDCHSGTISKNDVIEGDILFPDLEELVVMNYSGFSAVKELRNLRKLRSFYFEFRENGEFSIRSVDGVSGSAEIHVVYDRKLFKCDRSFDRYETVHETMDFDWFVRYWLNNKN